MSNHIFNGEPAVGAPGSIARRDQVAAAFANVLNIALKTLHQPADAVVNDQLAQKHFDLHELSAVVTCGGFIAVKLDFGGAQDVYAVFKVLDNGELEELAQSTNPWEAAASATLASCEHQLKEVFRDHVGNHVKEELSRVVETLKPVLTAGGPYNL